MEVTYGKVKPDLLDGHIPANKLKSKLRQPIGTY